MITDEKQRVSASATGFGRTETFAQPGDRWQPIGVLADRFVSLAEGVRS